MTTLTNQSNRTRCRKRPRSVASVPLIKSSLLLSCYLTKTVHCATWPSPGPAEMQPTVTNASKLAPEVSSITTTQDENLYNSYHNVVRRREEIANIDSTPNISIESNNGNLEQIDSFLNSLTTEGVKLTHIDSSAGNKFSSSMKNQISGSILESRIIVSTADDFNKVDDQIQDPRSEKSFDEKNGTHESFMSWCRDVLGIYAVVEIQFFDYRDFMNIDPFQSLEDDIVTSEVNSESTGSTLKVRGLAASADIEIGDVVVGIPLKSLWSVTTLIDTDPILGGDVMGPEARRKHGWSMSTVDDQDTSTQMMDLQFYEMPLLAVALLYHVQLGQTSMFAPYINILKDTPTDSLPFLWSAQRIRASAIASEGLRTVARGIRLEMKEMYDTVVKVLVDQHPHVFGKNTANGSGKDWMFSYEKFQWAFAIINSRHWRLPIEDLEISQDYETQIAMQKSSVDVVSSSAPGEQLPPADMPTEHWIKEQDKVDEESLHGRLPVDARHPSNFFTAARHSFLAPVADLLNFGPPCTRGRYNKNTQAFEIIASCSFLKGQEVTFWYSDDCQHVMMGVYGFSHGLIPSCPTSEDLRLQTEVLEEELVGAYSQLELIQWKLDDAETALNNCECSRNERKSYESLIEGAESGSSVRGSSRKPMKRESKPSIRRTYSRRTEF